jgi:hypothetical protein
LRNEDEAEEVAAGEVEGTVWVEGLVASGFGEVSEGCDLFLPEETGEGGEGALGIVAQREPQTRDHLSMAEFCGDCGRERCISPD